VNVEKRYIQNDKHSCAIEREGEERRKRGGKG
jgi:hypothetical protein